MEHGLDFAEKILGYCYRGRILLWGVDLPSEVKQSMQEDKEIALLHDAQGHPYSFLLIDSYGTIRESPYTHQGDHFMKEFEHDFGIYDHETV